MRSKAVHKVHGWWLVVVGWGGEDCRCSGGRAESAAVDVCIRCSAGRVCVSVPWVGRAGAGARAAAGAEVGSIECGSESPLDGCV